MEYCEELFYKLNKAVVASDKPNKLMKKTNIPILAYHVQTVDELGISLERYGEWIQELMDREKLAKDADVSTNTYSKGVKILESGNEELINETISGQKSINKAFNELKKNVDTDKYLMNGMTVGWN